MVSGSHTTQSRSLTSLYQRLHVRRYARLICNIMDFAGPYDIIGPEHHPDAQGNPQPSFCTLPMFHAPHQGAVPPGGGYASGDGHLFSCRNPVVLQNAFHV
jgi:hypothetical protein